MSQQFGGEGAAGLQMQDGGGLPGIPHMPID